MRFLLLPNVITSAYSVRPGRRPSSVLTVRRSIGPHIFRGIPEPRPLGPTL